MINVQGVLRSKVPIYLQMVRSWGCRSVVVRRFSQEHGRIFSILDRCNLKELSQFLDKYPEAVNYHNGDKITPLHYLAGGSVWMGVRLPVDVEPPKEFVQVLLEKGADKEALNHDGLSPLDTAVRVGYAVVAKELINAKTTVKPKMFDDAILRTVNFDPYFRMEGILLEEGIDLIKEGPRLLTFLISSIAWSIQMGEKKKHPLYLDRNRIEREYCPFIEKKIEFLLEKGVDPDMRFEGKTALQALLNRLDPIESGRLEDQILRRIVPIIAKYSKDFTVCDENGWSYLHFAVHRGLPSFAKELVARGLSMYQEDKQGVTPYHLAFTNFSQGMYSALNLEAVVCNPKDVVGIVQRLPYALSDYWQKQEPVKYYSIQRQLVTGFFALDLASDNQLERELAGLYNCPGEQSPMVRALENAEVKKIRELISQGWNANIENENAIFHRNRPFYPVLQAICKDSNKRLLARQIITALVSEPTSGITLESEFRAALQCGEEEKIYLLLDLGFTPNLIEQSSGKDFTVFMWDWFCDHFGDNSGWQKSEFYPGACRLIKCLTDKGYLQSHPGFERYKQNSWLV